MVMIGIDGSIAGSVDASIDGLIHGELMVNE